MKKSFIRKSVFGLTAAVMFFHSSAFIHAAESSSQPAAVTAPAVTAQNSVTLDAKQTELKNLIEEILRLGAEASSTNVSEDAASDDEDAKASKGWHAIFKIILVLYTHNAEPAVTADDQPAKTEDAAKPVQFEPAAEVSQTTAQDAAAAPAVEPPVEKTPAVKAPAAAQVEISIKQNKNKVMIKAKVKEDKKSKNSAAYKAAKKNDGDDDEDENDDDDDHGHDDKDHEKDHDHGDHDHDEDEGDDD